MTQPTPFVRGFDFTDFATSYPTTPPPGVRIDAEFDAVELTLEQALANLALIQRDDGRLVNQSVRLVTLHSEVIAALALAGTEVSVWATATAYTQGEIVVSGPATYLVGTSHTSGTLAADVAANRLVRIFGNGSTAVSLLDFGAIGEGGDDTDAFMSAVDSGESLYIPIGKTFAVEGNITGFRDGQSLIGGGGTIVKLGTEIAPLILLDEGVSNIHVHGLILDGQRDNFLPAQGVDGILGHLNQNLRVTSTTFRSFPDDGLKLRDSANTYVAGCLFEDIWENAIELHNYSDASPIGSSYTADRPTNEGDHCVIGNTIRRVSQYENPAGPLVDAVGIFFAGAPGRQIHNMRVIGNHVEDCLRGIAAEQNETGAEADGFIILGNTIKGSVSGGTGDNIFGKQGIHLVGLHNGIVRDNVITNPVNHNPVGSETSGIYISANLPGVTSQNIEVSGNRIIDNTGATPRTQWGIYVLTGTNIHIHHNRIEGTSSGGIHVTQGDGFHIHENQVADAPVRISIDPACTNVSSHSNEGGELDYSWRQIVPLTFAFDNIPATALTFMYPEGRASFAADAELIIPCPGRIVGMAVINNAAVGGGELGYKVYGNNVEEVGLTIATGDFGTGRQALKRQSSADGAQLTAGQRILVRAISDSLTPTTIDTIVTVFLDIGMKQ